MIDFKFTDLNTLYNAARTLIEHHAREFHIKDLNDYLPTDELLNLEKNDLIVTAAAIEDSHYVGYILWLISRHQGLNGLVGKLGPWYVIPSRRGVGIRLFKYSLCGLRERGCKFALPTLPMNEKRRRGPLGQPFEMTYLLEL